ncbi:MAG: helix-turn-helix domain-containing protein [Okeania sp. SIO3B5]|uniref:helix-turn-helix domain-containing protein n=1 Tax=Okeania sp. SIO3B5 TaxID=2607811 RepID=UPI0014010AD8|nr:helix-turn-helix domain-containing protein [Okeania sp. SIO3B5]NEO56114.1 helix-turn-helix domain-containing protein [Okeania sp. SIO3B5]
MSELMLIVMRTAYQYKLKPNQEQVSTIELWLDLLRRQYKYRLGERFSWWSENRCQINSCPLIMPTPKLKNNPDYYSQKKDLVNTKDKFPNYKLIHSQVLQDCIKRVISVISYQLSVISTSTIRRQENT